MEPLRKYLKELVESDCLAVEGKLFHALTVDAKQIKKPQAKCPPTFEMSVCGKCGDKNFCW